MKVINIFGGPGTGKSTTAASVFALLKRNHHSAEFANEYAKELVYDQCMKRLEDQLLVTAQQNHRLHRLRDQVDYVVTDSPLLLGSIYATGVFASRQFDNLVLSLFNSYDNVNVVLRRTTQYENSGRLQSEQAAQAIDDRIINLLDRHEIPYTQYDTDHLTAQKIYQVSVVEKTKRD